MGAVPSQLLGRQHLFQSTMKAFAAAALVATASAAPEAKPWLVHPAAIPAVLPGDLTAHASSGELVTLPNGAQVPDTTLSVKAAAADHLAAKSATYAAHGLYVGYGLPLAGHLWKRDAEAKPEAEPWLGYGYGLGGLYGGYGLGYSAAPVVAAPAVPLCINGVAPLGHGLCKRDADADAEAKPEADAWYGYGGLYGYGLGLGYGGYGLGYGYGKRSADAEAKPEANAWYGYGLGLGYGGYGYGGLYGYGKRSADADAKPWLGYGGLYGGWAYGVPALVAPPNGAVTPPYTAAQVAAAADHFAAKGKRSADAYYGYGGYGLGLGYGYGGYGYLG